MAIISTVHRCAASGPRTGAALALALLLVAGFASARDRICRVAASTSTAAGNGSNWTDQVMALQAALVDPDCTEIWVKAGVYTPGSARTDTFTIGPGVAVYGGFAGGEAARYQRDLRANHSVLSGDIDYNDRDTDGNHIDETWRDIVASNSAASNSYHVVTMDGATGAPITDSTVLDGFTITGGDADKSSALTNGGGLFCNGHDPGQACSPTLANLTFSGNEAAQYGGAMYCDGTSLGNCNPTVTGVTFSGNRANFGGALFSDSRYSGTSSPRLTNVTFSANAASDDGGAMTNDGANNGNSRPTLTNVTFSGNDAAFGGAIANIAHNGGTCAATLHNVILWDGKGTGTDPEIYNFGSATANIDHSIVEGGCPGGTTCMALVVGDANLGYLGDHGGFTPTMLPGYRSAAIDKADGASCPGTDQRGIVRPAGPHCDIGAVEVSRVPSLTLTDNTDYVHYGQLIRYVVTLQNPGGTRFNDTLSVVSSVPPQLYYAAVHWQCLNDGSVCGHSGAGELDDGPVTLLPYASVRWVVGGPVKDNASELAAFRMVVSATDNAGQRVVAGDIDQLGLFRDGFDGD